MIASRLLPFSLVGLSLTVAACGGEGITLPDEGEPADIEVIDADVPREGRVNDVLSPLVVRVTDSRDRPVAGAEVVFSFVDGDVAGVPTPAVDMTDADGLASTTITLGSVAATYTGTARVPVDEGRPAIEASFTVTSYPADAASIRPVLGDNQIATVNSALPEQLVVEVTDASNNPIPNVAIQWTAEGGGSVSATSTFTGPDGRASVVRILGGIAGAQTTVADAGDLIGSPVTFTSTATAGNAAGITKVQGDNQSGNPGEKLALPLIVEVRDQLGNPIADRPVTWVVGTGGGSVSAENTPTNSDGRATTDWTLGPAVGANSVNAVVSGVGTVTFNAMATAGSPSAANSEVSASPSTITAGSGQSTITVVVRDAGNNPVSGASVTLQATGSGNSINPGSASTGANGVATFTFSSTVAEPKTITASAGGVTINDQATIQVQRAGSTTQIESDEPDPSTVNQPVRVEFVVTANGGTPTGQVTITADGGPETCSASVEQGFCDITFTTAGTNRRLLASYSGDPTFGPSSDRENHRVEAAPPAGTVTTITADAPDPSDAGAPITVSFTVTSTSGSPSGNVEVTGGGGSCSASVAQGSCQLTPTATGPITLTATYQGGPGFSGSSDTEDHIVTPVPANTPPVANDDAFPTGTDQAINAPAGSLTANDSPPEPGDTYTTALASPSTTAAGGTVAVGADGSFTYTPAAGYVGPDSFEYTLSDGRGGSDTATVSIAVGSPAS